MEENKITNTKFCVTGGAGYIGSWLVKKLLLKGYTVHATLRDLTLPHAEERLLLFEADIYNPDAFESAILGCECVFHLATPMQHTTSKFKNTSEAAIAGVNSILESCIRSKTVKRVIYTALVLFASPLKEDGTSFKNVFDGSCWTPLHHKFYCIDDFAVSYVTSKTLVEKEVLKYNDKEKYGLDVKLSTNRRILCAQAYPTRTEVANYYRENFPEFMGEGGAMKENGRVESRSTKLIDEGFDFKYDVKKILDDTVKCARRLGSL